jgi:hypothetical protein
MPDPVTGLTIGAAVGVAAKQAQDFLASVSGHPGESVGTILGTITKRRLDNVEAVGNRAHLTLLNIGVKAQAVPLPVLMPVLEGASLQEEDSMQEVWANLLANAADPRRVAPVAATFPVILRELSLHNVRLLNAIDRHIAERAAKLNRLQKDVYCSFKEAELRMIFDEANKPLHNGSDSDTDRFEYSFDLLRRHNLVTETIWPRTIDKYDAIKNPKPDFEIELDADYSLSELGRCFITACKKPTHIQTA